MKHTVLKGAALLCALLLVCVGLTACNQNQADPDASATDTTTTAAENVTTPSTVTRPTVNPVDAAGSALIGEWNVKSDNSTITKLTFNEDGTAVITTANGQLGGTFVQTGDDQLSLSTTSSTLEGTFTMDGDTVVFTTQNATLTLTKVK